MQLKRIFFDKINGIWAQITAAFQKVQVVFGNVLAKMKGYLAPVKAAMDKLWQSVESLVLKLMPVFEAVAVVIGAVLAVVVALAAGIMDMIAPLVQALILVRLATQGSWPERLQPAVFIFVAPPSVVGLAFAQFGAPAPLAWGAWGIALFSLLAALTQLRRILALPFAVPHWAMSFPLAAFAALTLRLGPPGSSIAGLGILALAAASLAILLLAIATAKGLRDGTLLAPEPVAAIQPAAP